VGVTTGREMERAPGRQVAAPEPYPAYLPYVGLAMSTILALTGGPLENGLSRAVFTAAVLCLAGAAAFWMLVAQVPYVERDARTRQCFVYYAVLIILIALLILLNPFFGFFGITGYLFATLLPGRWKAPAIVATAALETIAQLGGIPHIHGAAIIEYCAVLLANVAVVGALFRAGMREDEYSEKRAKMIDALAEANRRLELTMAENAGLHAQLMAQAREAGILDERRRMAGEIHDTIAQGLTGIIAQLEAAGLTGGAAEHRRHLNLALDLARDSLAEARRSVQALRPGPLDDARLPEALTHLAQQWQQTSDIPVRVDIDGSPIPLRPALEVVLFRAAQEALVNIAKHARAAQVGMTLTYTHDVVVLDILDDGKGFDTSAHMADGGGYGLAAMRRRLRQIGGVLVIESAPGDGTTLSASVPAWGIEDSP
jgi:signal transduction histidine kinase